MGSVAIFKGKLVKFLAKAGILIPKRLQSDRSLTPDQGETAFNTTTNKLEVYNGTSWQSLSESGTLAHPTSNSTFEYQTWNTLTAPNGPLTGTENTAIGVNAGNSITNGGHNTAIGYNAATAIGNSSFNTAIGSLSMSNLAGSGATCFGNTGIGWGSLFTLTSGIQNVGIGYLSGNSLDSASSYNTCINTNGAQTSTVLKGTVTIGRDYDANIDDSAGAVATANNDFVLGTSLHNYKLPGKVVTPVTLAAQNEIRFADADSSNYVGFKAQTTVATNEVYELPTATGTVGQVLGISSIPATGTTRLAWTSGTTGTLVHPVTGSTVEYGTVPLLGLGGIGGTSNTVIGVDAGSALTYGSSNTLIGFNAGVKITGAVDNIAIGNSALPELTAGSGSNVAIGYALSELGKFANTGNNNIGIGLYSGLSLYGGSNNTFIGKTDLNGITTVSGSVAIGNDSMDGYPIINANNDFVLGTPLHNYRLPGSEFVFSGNTTLKTELSASGWKYEKFKNIGTEETFAQGIFFKPDGLRMYIVGDTGNDITQYTLTTAWDVSTAGTPVTSPSIGAINSIPVDLYIKSDGLTVYVIGDVPDSVYQFTLTTAWDISTLQTGTYLTKSVSNGGAETAVTGLDFSTDGTKMFVTGQSLDGVYTYTLSTAWDITTATLTAQYILDDAVGNKYETTVTAIRFNSTGTKMYVLGSGKDSIFEFNLSIAWDTNTAELNTILSLYYNDASYFGDLNTYSISSPVGLYIGPSNAYVVCVNNNAVFQYSTTTPSLTVSGGNVSFKPPVTVLNTLSVSGSTKIDNNLTVIGNQSTIGNQSVTGDLTISGGDIIMTSTTNNIGSASTLTNTLNISNAVTLSGNTKNIIIGNNGAAGSSTNITLGSQTGGAFTSTNIYGSLTVNGDQTITGDLSVNGGDIVLPSSCRIGHLFSVTHTLDIGNAATASGNTKTINMGTNGSAGSTTNINLGSSTSGSLSIITINGALKLRNVLTTAAVAPTLASATAIAPTAYITFVSGTTAIATITAPSTMTGGGGEIVLIPTGAWTTNTTGNIALATTAVVNRAMTLFYDSQTGKWYPSY